MLLSFELITEVLIGLFLNFEEGLASCLSLASSLCYANCLLVLHVAPYWHTENEGTTMVLIFSSHSKQKSEAKHQTAPSTWALL